MGEDDIVLADTGAIKMWRARPYLTCRPSACPIPNGLSTMSFALPGAPGARMANPDRKILAANIDDNSFLMNSQEPETAIREKLHFVALLRVDQNYGLIKWSMETKRGQAVDVHFNNPDFLKHAKNFGARGKLVGKANDPVSLLNKTFCYEGIPLIACPVDYPVNIQLSATLETAKSS